MSTSNILGKIYTNTWNKKFWHNVSQYCDGKRHPGLLLYRRYRRGKTRCLECGAKLGKIKCKRYSYKKYTMESIFEAAPLFHLLTKKGGIRGR